MKCKTDRSSRLFPYQTLALVTGSFCFRPYMDDIIQRRPVNYSLTFE